MLLTDDLLKVDCATSVGIWRAWHFWLRPFEEPAVEAGASTLLLVAETFGG